MENDMTARLPRAVFASIPLSLAAFPAFAHHMMGGKTPSTFMEGFLSGLGHPVIGLDHFAFLLAIGIAVGAGGLSLMLPVAFMLAMAVGVVFHVQGIGIPWAEAIVAASVLLAGILLVRGRTLPVWAWGTLFAVAGLFHGYALGESVYGTDRSTLGAYLLGLVLVQSALTIGIAVLVRQFDTRRVAMAARLVGALVIGVGAAALVGNL
jgi:urease accessory protein